PVDPASRSDGLTTIAVRRHPGGVVSGYLWEHAAPGTRLMLGSPVGEIALPAQRPDDVLLLSRGSGITPMLAIASTLAGEGHPGRLAWLHHARRAEAAPSAGRRAARAARRGAGRLADSHLAEVAPWHADAAVYLCGPEGLADGLETVLGAERFADVLRERFTATTGPIPEGDGGTVTHLTSGVTAHNAGTTLLE